mmetsp:Transcript_3777/g.4953  ORF Transcript_3777/g.4953 Transcript_3777/m.4953 type:complete len:487 (+) Transcript_3777:117-1577(+)
MDEQDKVERLRREVNRKNIFRTRSLDDRGSVRKKKQSREACPSNSTSHYPRRRHRSYTDSDKTEQENSQPTGNDGLPPAGDVIHSYPTYPPPAYSYPPGYPHQPPPPYHYHPSQEDGKAQSYDEHSSQYPPPPPYYDPHQYYPPPPPPYHHHAYPAPYYPPYPPPYYYPPPPPQECYDEPLISSSNPAVDPSSPYIPSQNDQQELGDIVPEYQRKNSLNDDPSSSASRLTTEDIKRKEKREKEAEFKKSIDTIKAKPKEERSTEEIKLVTSFESRRHRKNIRSRQRTKENREEMQRILAKNEEDRTEKEKAWFQSHLLAKKRKNENDRQRRKRLKMGLLGSTSMSSEASLYQQESQADDHDDNIINNTSMAISNHSTTTVQPQSSSTNYQPSDRNMSNSSSVASASATSQVDMPSDVLVHLMNLSTSHSTPSRRHFKEEHTQNLHAHNSIYHRSITNGCDHGSQSEQASLNDSPIRLFAKGYQEQF